MAGPHRQPPGGDSLSNGEVGEKGGGARGGTEVTRHLNPNQEPSTTTRGRRDPQLCHHGAKKGRGEETRKGRGEEARV